MRTVRCSSRLLGREGGVRPGVCLPEGGCLSRGTMYTSLCGQTDTYENITFLQLLLWTVKTSDRIRSRKPSHIHTWMQALNLSASVKPFMTKLQNVFVALVNMDIFQMTLKFSLFIVDF